MNFRTALLFWFLSYATAQDANCDFSQNVQPGSVYYVYNPNYPNNYPPAVQCRWTAICPSGYNCQLNCTEINIPYTQSCTMDRFLVSRTGDPQLTGAETYCGRGTLSIKSTAQRLSIGLVAARNSPGGRFICQLTAQQATPSPQCRCGERRQNRIVGGEETGVNEFPMMVGLADVRISQIICGAVIISTEYVLTAAHCVRNQSINNYAVVVGEHNVDTGDSPATTAYRIIQFIIHPLYSESNFDYDVAIVKVNSAIVFSDRVGPVCLPFKFVNTDFTGRKVTILGWGTLFPGGPTSNVLRKVDLDVISQSRCRTNVSSLTERQICTFTPGKDACQDDSGGPALFTDPATGLLFNIGVVSFGRFCASDEPGVNTRVTSVLGWIQANTAGADYCVR